MMTKKKTTKATTMTDQEVYDFFFSGDANFHDNALIAHHKNVFKKCVDISRAKNHDYGGDKDVLYNFRMSEQFGVSVEKGIMVRLSDKFSRIATLIDSEAQVKDEKIEDTLLDMINYASILLFALKEKNENTSDRSG